MKILLLLVFLMNLTQGQQDLIPGHLAKE